MGEKYLHLLSFTFFLIFSLFLLPAVAGTDGIELDIAEENITVIITENNGISISGKSGIYPAGTPVILSQTLDGELNDRIILVKTESGKKNKQAVDITINGICLNRSGVYSNAGAFVLENANVRLTLKSDNILKSGTEPAANGRAGLEVPDGSEILIRSEDGGKLTVYGGNGTNDGSAGAGIGSAGAVSESKGKDSGLITIESGIVEAYGGSVNANSGNTLFVYINGAAGAGIGGGAGGNFSKGGNATVLIKGGNVKATGGSIIDNSAASNTYFECGAGAGIGGGAGGNGYSQTSKIADGAGGDASVTIENGIVEAYGGSLTKSDEKDFEKHTSFDSGGGAGIGGGAGGSCSQGGNAVILIRNGTIFAKAGTISSQSFGGSGTGIGGGAGAGSGDGSHKNYGGRAVVTIYGGTITAIGGDVDSYFSGAGNGIGGGAAGYGANNDGGDAEITIYDCEKITAIGGSGRNGGSGGGIGGGSGSRNGGGGKGVIKIYGGNTEAVGGSTNLKSNGGAGSGIGGGSGGDSGGHFKNGGDADIEIFSGKIKAIGGSTGDASAGGSGAGIGSGSGGSSGDSGICYLIIHDGEITAVGGNTGDWAEDEYYGYTYPLGSRGGAGAAAGSAGGGGGLSYPGGYSGFSDIVIENGTIKAVGGNTGEHSQGGAGAAVGSGGGGGAWYGDAGGDSMILIQNGTIKAFGGSIGKNGFGGAGAAVGSGGGGDSTYTHTDVGSSSDTREGSPGGNAEVWIYDGQITAAGGTAGELSYGGAGTGIGGGSGSHVGNGGNGSVLIYSGKIVAAGGKSENGGLSGIGTAIGGGSGGFGVERDKYYDWDGSRIYNGTGGNAVIEILNDDVDIIAFGGIGGGYRSEKYMDIPSDYSPDPGDIQETPDFEADGKVIIQGGIVSVFSDHKGHADFLNSGSSNAENVEPVTLFVTDSKTAVSGISGALIQSRGFKTETRESALDRLIELKEFGWTDSEIQKYEMYVADGTATVWLPVQPDNKNVQITKTGYLNFDDWTVIEENAFDGTGDFIRVSPLINEETGGSTSSNTNKAHKTTTNSEIKTPAESSKEQGYEKELPTNSLAILLFALAVAVFCFRRVQEKDE
ncbi:hypothetical protein MmiEs2_14200 [Methanimicrococcus stummii]|uniref:Uncharacterized protein n=1 Tax=Methanimicrococcus stummii TaxID=3028294 RepID=A0AA96ZZE6_9EURY|nr:hypothetical protein MmiEs2_14200 [Methanimicrococcus sp. Es2]